MPQTSVLSTEVVAYAGQRIQDVLELSVLAEDVSITAGQPILRGTQATSGGVQGVSVTNGATVDASTFLGFAVASTYRDTSAYAVGDTFSVLTHGIIVVATTAAVTAGNPVWVGNATAQLLDIDDATGTGLVQCPGAKFLTTTSGAGLARVLVFPTV